VSAELEAVAALHFPATHLVQAEAADVAVRAVAVPYLPATHWAQLLALHCFELEVNM